MFRTKYLASSALAILSAGGVPLFAQLPPIPEPVENPTTAEKAALGKILFWDEQLSSDNTVACGTCHRPEFGGSDARSERTPGRDEVLFTADDVFGSPGVIRSDAANRYLPNPVQELELQVTGRLSPSFIGAQYFTNLFLDGRAASAFVDPQTGQLSIAGGGALESQAAGPPLASVEMAHQGRTWDQISSKLRDAVPLYLARSIPPDSAAALAANPTYPDLFAAAFGDRAISAERIAFAVAAYERTLLPDQTPWDAYAQGDASALTADQRAGLELFMGKAACANCHPPPLFADDGFHNIGLRPALEDPGRAGITGRWADRGKFKTPSLRNVGLRPRFMHNGGLDSLAMVVDFFDRGVPFLDNLDPLRIGSPGLTSIERGQLTEFLATGLTDPRVAAAIEPFDRPTLHSESDPPNPTLYGEGTPGTDGATPGIIANCPPNIGNLDFKLGIKKAFGGATAVLGISTAKAAPGQSFYGAALHIDLDHLVAAAPVDLLGFGPGQGWGTFQVAIPRDRTLIGLELYVQWFVLESASPMVLSATEGAELTIF